MVYSFLILFSSMHSIKAADARLIHPVPLFEHTRLQCCSLVNDEWEYLLDTDYTTLACFNSNCATIDIDCLTWIKPARITCIQQTPANLTLLAAQTKQKLDDKKSTVVLIDSLLCNPGIKVDSPVLHAGSSRWLRVIMTSTTNNDEIVSSGIQVYGLVPETFSVQHGWPLKSYLTAKKLKNNDPGQAEKIINEALQSLQLDREAIPGYQYGFFYYSLLGKVLELKNQRPFALKPYRIASAYMSDVSSLTDTKPAAELYCSLGRACRAVGWDFDAENYFLAALAVCTNDIDIWQNASVGLAELYINDGEFTRAATVLKDLFVKVPEPSRDAYGMYGKTLFYTGKPREGFSVLKEGLLFHPVPAGNAEKDPILSLYIDRLGEADETEVYEFYMALGTQLDMLEPIKKNEKTIAFVANERTLLTKLFDYITKEDDIKRIQERIAARNAAGNKK
jgi:tetratricopeptide (TPR) repeat protein